MWQLIMAQTTFANAANDFAAGENEQLSSMLGLQLGTANACIKSTSDRSAWQHQLCVLTCAAAGLDSAGISDHEAF